MKFTLVVLFLLGLILTTNHIDNWWILVILALVLIGAEYFLSKKDKLILFWVDSEIICESQSHERIVAKYLKKAFTIVRVSDNEIPEIGMKFEAVFAVLKEEEVVGRIGLLTEKGKIFIITPESLVNAPKGALYISE